MSEINALVSGNATPKIKGEAVAKEENSGTDSAAMGFAAIFGNWMTQIIGQGQSSDLQSSDPAGKEANSGETGLLGLEGMLGSLRTIAGLNIGSGSGQEINTLLSQNNLKGDVIDSGIESGQLQGDKSPLTELDQYRVLITQLLQDMSGEISKVSYKPADIQELLTQLSQRLDLNQNLNATEENPQLAQRITEQGDLAKTLKTLLQQISNTESTQNNSARILNKINDAQEQVINTNQNSEKIIAQAVSLNRNPDHNFNAAEKISSDQNLSVPSQDRLSTESRSLQANIQKEAGQDKSQNKDTGSDGNNPNLGNINFKTLTLNDITSVENKTEATSNLPIWLQVAQELQAKVLHQLPAVRELQIQLHPAELGQISISVALDNGQVHLHMLASEAATGQILQNNFTELREALSQSGVQCGMMQMGFSNSNQNYNQSRNQTLTSQIKNKNKQESSDNSKLDPAGLTISSLKGPDQEIDQMNRINVMA